MDRLEFNCMFDFAKTLQVILRNADDDYPLISVYGKYEAIKQILEDLIMSGVGIANEIELQEYEVAHYDKEFVLYLSKNGVNVEKSYSNDYLYGAGDISFVHEDCNCKLLSYIQSKTIYEFGIVDRDEKKFNCNECRECTCKENSLPVTTSATVYKVNGKEVDENTYLKEYSKIVEEMNALRCLFCW